MFSSQYAAPLLFSTKEQIIPVIALLEVPYTSVSTIPEQPIMHQGSHPQVHDSDSSLMFSRHASAMWLSHIQNMEFYRLPESQGDLEISIPMFTLRSCSCSGHQEPQFGIPGAAEEGWGWQVRHGPEEQGWCVQSLSGGSRVGENVILSEQFAGILKLVPVN